MPATFRPCQCRGHGPYRNAAPVGWITLHRSTMAAHAAPQWWMKRASSTLRFWSTAVGRVQPADNRYRSLSSTGRTLALSMA